MLNSKSNVRNIGDILGKIPSSFTFQDPPLIDAPYTTITKLDGSPRQIPDPSKTLRPAMGIERIHFNKLNKLSNEVGSFGQAVYSISNTDARIRFVGESWRIFYNINASRPITSGNTTDFIEITFYGTGLNLLWIGDSGTPDIRLTVDGGVESVSTVIPAFNAILGGDNYNANVIFPIVSGLPLGIHTVKLRDDAGSFFETTGVEILNESIQIKIPQGEVFANGLKYTNSTLQSIDYNTGFDGNPALNGRGGRVIEYIKSNGRIGKVIQQTDSSAAFLSSANHENEQEVRRIGFREFGANKADDFSTLTTGVSDRYFSLDDGTTCLVGNDVRTFSGEHLQINTGSGFINLTFVGTGLDIIDRFFTGTLETFRVSIDGINVGTFNNAGGASNLAIRKIASGLPYGTHTVQIAFDSGSLAGDHALTEFIIYAPKKPTIPQGSLEIGEYFLMATYNSSNAGGTTTAEAFKIPNGVLFKSTLREFKFTGSGFSVSDAGTFASSLYRSGFITFSTANGSTQEYNFFGTGFVLEGSSNSGGAITFNVAIDGVLNASGVGLTSGLTNNGGGSYTSAAGSGLPRRLEFTGLTLGMHKVLVTRDDASALGGLGFSAGIHIITPIHYPNTKAGSLSMGPIVQIKSSEDVSGLDLTKAKAWLVFDQVNGIIKSSYNIAAVLNTVTGASLVYFEKPFKNKNYSLAGMAHVVGNNYPVTLGNNALDLAKTANFALIVVGTGLANSDDLSVIFFGELADEESE